MDAITAGILLSMLLALGACTDNDLTSRTSNGTSLREPASLDLDSDSARNSFSSIQVTILSSNGTDLTSSMPVLHSQISSSTLQRRSSAAYHIQRCPVSDPYISNSWCERTLSPQSYQSICEDVSPAGRGEHPSPSHFVYNEGNCAPDEVCVGANGGEESLQSYCVSTNDFVQIGQNSSTANGEQSAGSLSGVVTAGFNAAAHRRKGSLVAVEAVLTSVNKKASLFATSLVMQAQVYDKYWRTVDDFHSHGYCLKCSSMTLVPFPETARRVKVDVVMPEEAPTGLLWLATYPYLDPPLD